MAGREEEEEEVEIYHNGSWLRSDADAASPSPTLHPVAAHLWLLVLQLLMNAGAPRKYDLDDYRCQQLLKVGTSPVFPNLRGSVTPTSKSRRWKRHQYCHGCD